MWIGFSVFLVMLLFAVQVLFNLYAASVLTAVSYDAARHVAESDDMTASMADAVEQARRSLGRYGNGVDFNWSGTSAEEVVLRVQFDNPSMQLPVLAGPAAFDTFDRTIRVRVERFR